MPCWIKTGPGAADIKVCREFTSRTYYNHRGIKTLDKWCKQYRQVIPGDIGPGEVPDFCEGGCCLNC
jgi:hypothetical protein